MADLTVLIRLHRHELDEKRRALTELYSAIAEIERHRLILEESFKREKAAVAAQSDIHFTFAQYVESVKKQRAQFDAATLALERQIELAKESLMETFSELKKYQMTQDERERLEEEERRFKESQAMDAIGLEGFRRRDDE